MSYLGTQMQAIQAGASAFIRAYRMATNGGPNSLLNVVNARMAQYNLTWAAYEGGLYDRRNGFATYLAENKLYGNTRAIYSLVESQVDFYGAQVYPGVIDDQGVPNNDHLGEGIPLLADDVQKAAIRQIFQWSNWATSVTEWVTYGAATGDAYLAPMDDVESGKVYIAVRRPWHVKEIHRDYRGYVESSVEEFPVWDPIERVNYMYRREMDKAIIREYKNTQLTSEVENIYGFVPLVYTQHRFSPELPGKPAFRGWKTLDEVNSIATRMDDYFRTQMSTPIGIAGSATVKPIQVGGVEQRVMEEGGIVLLQFEGDVKSMDMKGNLEATGAETRVESLLAELRTQNIESSTYEKLREAGATVSGVAARRLLGDVEDRLSGPQGNYDSGQLLALRQCLAIAGMRAKERQEGWASRTDQQRVFLPFDMDSYQKGDLNFGIAKRPFFPDSDLERAQTKQALYAAYQAGEMIDIPVEWQMVQDGISPDDLKSLQQAQKVMRVQNGVGDGAPDPIAELAKQKEMMAAQ